MTQPNLIETIEKALEKTSWSDTEYEFIEMNAVKWLRALLEENKRITGDRDFWFENSQQERELCKGQKGHLHQELQQTREELERMKVNFGAVKNYSSSVIDQSEHIHKLRIELEHVKSERDLAVRDGLMQSIDHLEHVETELEIIVKLKNLIQSLCTELSAKDKVLEWYANEENYDVNVTNQWEPVLPISSDNGGQARTILSQYRRTTDET